MNERLVPWIRLSLLAILLTNGCTKADVDKIVTQVQEQTQIVQQEVSKVVSFGSIKVNLNGPVEFAACNVSLIVIGDGRPNVVQVRSYSSIESETFPSFFFQGTTQVSSLERLVGESITGELFIGIDSAANVWSTSNDLPAIVAFSALDGSELVASISASLQGPDGKDQRTTGEVRAVLNR